MRWFAESQNKRSLDGDKAHLKWVDPYLKKYTLNQISRDLIDRIAEKKLAKGVQPQQSIVC